MIPGIEAKVTRWTSNDRTRLQGQIVKSLVHDGSYKPSEPREGESSLPNKAY